MRFNVIFLFNACTVVFWCFHEFAREKDDFGALFAWLEVELARGARLGKVDFEMPEAN